MNKALLHQLKNYGSKSIGFILFLICAVSIYNKVASNENLHQISDDIKAQLATIADRKSTRLNSSHSQQSRMPSSA